MSRSCSAASRRTDGLARVPLVVGVAASSAGAPGVVTAAATGAGSAASAGGVPDATAASSIEPMTSPTATVSPSGLRICWSTPACSAAISTLTLSVSSSTRVSPMATGSPSVLSQVPTTASTTDSPSWGTRISVGMLLYSECPCPHLGNAGKCLLDQVRLVERVHRLESLGRAGPARPADVAQFLALGQIIAQPPLDEVPGAHIARLLLHPDDLGRVGVGGDDLAYLLLREGIELLDPHDRDLLGQLAGSVLLAGDQIDPDLARAENQPADRVLIIDRFVVDHRLEVAVGQRLRRGGRGGVSQQLLRREDHQWPWAATERGGLIAQQVKVLSGGGAVRQPDVVAGGQL